MKFYVMKSWPNWKENTPIDMEASSSDEVSYETVPLDEQPTCPLCGHKLKYRRWTPPYKVELVLRTANFGDVAFVSGAGLIGCERFHQLYATSGLTGLKYEGTCEVVKIVRRAQRKKPLPPTPDYHAYTFTYYSAAADLVRSGAVYKHESPATCSGHAGGIIVRHDRVVINELTWDGTDVFTPLGFWGVILVSERFYDWYHSCGFNENLVFIPAEEYSIDFDPKYDVEKYGNGLAFLNK